MMHSTALFSSRSLRLTFTAGCLALVALSGCAPVDAAEEAQSIHALASGADPASEAARQATPGSTVLAAGALAPTRQDLRGDLLRAGDLSGSGLALAPVAALAPSAAREVIAGRTEVAPDPLTPAYQDLRTGLVRPTTITDGVINPSLDRAFDPSGFADLVGRTGAGYAPGVAALPNMPVGDDGSMETALFNVVRRSITDPTAELSSERPDCGERAEHTCAELFLRGIEGIDGALSRALAPHARQLVPVARELRVTLWNYKVDGEVAPVAVTLHGRDHSGLVGIIVFR